MKLRSIILVGILLASSSQVNAQWFNLVRTVSGNSLSAMDTKGGDFTETGSMIVNNNTVSSSSVYCSNNGSCIEKSDANLIVSVNNFSVELSSFASGVGEDKTLQILSIHPTLILLESDLTGWEIREYERLF